jgi:hypothetical protein
MRRALLLVEWPPPSSRFGPDAEDADRDAVAEP